MSKTDIKEALMALEPKTKAATVRDLMPLIEAKIAEGVLIADIVSVLNGGGLELTEGTLKSYLNRNRKRHGKLAGRIRAPGSSQAKDSQSSEQARGEPVWVEAGQQGPPEAAGPVSIQDLDRIMKPDPAEQENELAQYERIGKQQRRNRKS